MAIGLTLKPAPMFEVRAFRVHRLEFLRAKGPLAQRVGMRYERKLLTVEFLKEELGPNRNHCPAFVRIRNVPWREPLPLTL